MKSDIKYIIKRIIVGVSIALILMLIKSNVFAQTISGPQSCNNKNGSENMSGPTLVNYSYNGIPYLRCRTNTNTYAIGTTILYGGNIVTGTDGFYTFQFSGITASHGMLPSVVIQSANTTFSSCLVNFSDQAIDNDYLINPGYKPFSVYCPNVYLSGSRWFEVNFSPNLDGLNADRFGYGISNITVNQNDSFIDVQSAINNQSQQQHQDSQNTQNAINNVNDSLTSDTTPSGSDTDSAYSNFGNSTAQNGVITQLITLPITLFTSINNNINTSCSRFDMGTLLGTHIYFNCINPSQYIGSQLWSVIDILASGFFVWYIGKKLIKVFENLSSMKEGDPVGD